MQRLIKLGLLLITLALLIPSILLLTGGLPYRIYVVHTGSMSPTIPSKSVVIVRVHQYHMGQPISFMTPNSVVTHRLVITNPDGTLGTKGDANAAIDPSYLPADKVIGGVVAAPRMVGYWIVFFRQPTGMLALLSIVVLLYLIWSLGANNEALAPQPA